MSEENENSISREESESSENQLIFFAPNSSEWKLLELPDNEQSNNDKLDGHRTFLHRLSKRRVRDPRLKIFTTNYDLCFERAASLQGLIIVDGFSFITPRRYDPNYFNYDIVRRTNSQDKTTNYLEGVFQLFKLHGSINWERNGGEIIESKDPDPQKACIIYPAHGKYQQSYIQPHLELFSRYLSSLREPNTCLIISGFGFNDDHLGVCRTKQF